MIAPDDVASTSHVNLPLDNDPPPLTHLDSASSNTAAPSGYDLFGWDLGDQADDTIFDVLKSHPFNSPDWTTFMGAFANPGAMESYNSELFSGDLGGDAVSASDLASGTGLHQSRTGMNSIWVRGSSCATQAEASPMCTIRSPLTPRSVCHR